jgi:preprotein translocase subunit SecG
LDFVGRTILSVETLYDGQNCPTDGKRTMGTFFGFLLSILALFLILLVLVQRGRGGGLAGALGGIGGSSAFGAKAGDVFTRITIVTATIWILVCMAAVYWARNRGDALSAVSGGSTRAPAAIEALPDDSDDGQAPVGTTPEAEDDNAQGPGAAAPESID